MEQQNNLPEGWEHINIIDAFSQISMKGKNIATKDCLPTGKFPVIDQGSEFIAGYFDDESKVINVDDKVIVFGDHTRNFKLVDFDFVVGADGVKIFKPNKNIEPSFFYYQCLSLNLPNKGYHRHFRYFKECGFFVPPLPEQIEIANKLDNLLAQVASIQARLEKIPMLLKQFRQSVLADAVSGKLSKEWRLDNNYSATEQFNNLYEIERDYLSQKLKDERSKIIKEKLKLRDEKFISEIDELPKGWVEKPFFELSLLNRGFDLPTSQRVEGIYPIMSSAGKIGWHNECKVKGGCVTVGRSGSVGQVFFTEEDCWVLNTALYVKDFGISDPKFIYWKLKSMNLGQFSSSTAVPTLNRNEFILLPVAIPPLEEQTHIVSQVEKLFAYADNVEQQVNNALKRVNNLTQAILAKAFKGELTAEWREQQQKL